MTEDLKNKRKLLRIFRSRIENQKNLDSTTRKLIAEFSSLVFVLDDFRDIFWKACSAAGVSDESPQSFAARMKASHLIIQEAKKIGIHVDIDPAEKEEERF